MTENTPKPFDAEMFRKRWNEADQLGKEGQRVDYALAPLFAERDALAAVVEQAPHEPPCQGDGHSGWPNYLPVKCACRKSVLPSTVLAARDAQQRAAAVADWAGWFEANTMSVGRQQTFTAGEVANLLRGPEPWGVAAAETEANR